MSVTNAGAEKVLEYNFKEHSMKPWLRDDTKDWIAQLENRIEDIGYYLIQTSEWCEEREIDRHQTVAACMIITILWVTHMRDESISKREIYELIGIQDWFDAPEEVCELHQKYKGCELEDLLNLAIDNL
jgi:hypothetical protein